ncbi:MAG: calcium-binding protein [Sphingomonas sp. 28-66-16]|nr:MAG: calcium-binding protein [Sphingomonas sp. 28-66-16]
MRSILLAALLAGASPGLAQQPPETAGPRTPPATQPPSATIMAEPVALMIGACDANGDARVTREEMRACVAHSFASVDPTNSGAIGYIGFSDWAERWLGDRNALPSPYETDANGDNRISLAELQAQFDKTFTRFDRDKDNVLVRAELLTLDSARNNPGDSRRRGRKAPPERQ